MRTVETIVELIASTTPAYKVVKRGGAASDPDCISGDHPDRLQSPGHTYGQSTQQSHGPTPSPEETRTLILPVRFKSTDSGNAGCPAMHTDVDSGEIIVQGPALGDPADLARLKHFGPDGMTVVVSAELLVNHGPKELHRGSKSIGLDEFGKLFRTFEHTAWRLETRRGYATDREDETYSEFLETGQIALDYDDWLRNIRRQVLAGKTIGRVRIVDEPPTGGPLFLLADSLRNTAAVEDIRHLPRSEADARGAAVGRKALRLLVALESEEPIATVLRLDEVPDWLWHVERADHCQNARVPLRVEGRTSLSCGPGRWLLARWCGSRCRCWLGGLGTIRGPLQCRRFARRCRSAPPKWGDVRWLLRGSQHPRDPSRRRGNRSAHHRCRCRGCRPESTVCAARADADRARQRSQLAHPWETRRQFAWVGA